MSRPSENLAADFRAILLLTDAFEIDKSLLNVHGDQLHTNLVANIQARKPLDELAFNGKGEKPDPGALRGSARDNGIELVSEPRFEQQGSR